MTKSLEVADTTKLPAEMRAQMLSNETSMFFNVALFEHGQRIAQMFAGSTMVPDHFKNNPGNCMIALNYASRIQADPFMMMQCMYVVHGNPGIEGKLVAALVNQSSKYSEPLEYQWIDANGQEVERHIVFGNNAKDGRGCRAVSVDAKSGKQVVGPTITWSIVHEEGWLGKSGSKWKTMPELMFMYRAASWFSNIHCPEVKLGMQTTEELGDIVTLGKGPGGTYSTDSGVAGADLKDLLDKSDPVDTTEKPEPEKKEPPEEAIRVATYEAEIKRKEDAEAKAAPPGFDELAKKYTLKYNDIGMANARLQSYLNFCAKDQDLSVDDVKFIAATKFDNFIKRFEFWLKEKHAAKMVAQKQAVASENQENQDPAADSPWIPNDKWFSMRTGTFAKGTGFKAFCMKNKDSFTELSDIKQEEIWIKYKTLYGDDIMAFRKDMDLPDFGPDPELEQEPPLTDQEPSKTVFCENHEWFIDSKDGKTKCKFCPAIDFDPPIQNRKQSSGVDTGTKRSYIVCPKTNFRTDAGVCSNGTCEDKERCEPYKAFLANYMDREEKF